MNKSQVEDDIYYGDNAEALISNPSYQMAITRVRAKLFEQFGTTGVLQKRKREALWNQIRVVDSFEQELENMLRDAALAKDDLKRSEKVKSIKR